MSELASPSKLQRLKDLRTTDTGRATELAAASMLNNVIQLGFVVLMTRFLNREGYAALATVTAGFLMLQVSGQAVQAAAARAMARWALTGHNQPYREVAGWTRRTLMICAAAAALGLAVGQPLAQLLGVEQYRWAASLIPLTGALWLLVCLQRGSLQGVRDFDAIAASIIFEAVLRLGFAIFFVLLGTHVTGAFAAATAAFAVLAIAHDRRLRTMHSGDEVTSETAEPTRLRTLVSWEKGVIASLFLVAILQNVDTILVNRTFIHDQAASYAAAAVAAKAVVWVAFGFALHLLPEATRRAFNGEDAHQVLRRAIMFLAAIGIPSIIIFFALSNFILTTAFGKKYGSADGALPILGIAMLMLSITMMSAQYLAAIGRKRQLPALAALAVVEIVLLSTGERTITQVAVVVALVQAAAAAVTLALAWWSTPADKAVGAHVLEDADVIATEGSVHAT